MVGIANTKGAQELTELLEFLGNVDMYRERFDKIIAEEAHLESLMAKYDKVQDIESLLNDAKADRSNAEIFKKDALSQANKIISEANAKRKEAETKVRDAGEELTKIRKEVKAAEAKIADIEKRDAVSQAEFNRIKDMRREINNMYKEAEDMKAKLNKAMESMGA